MSNATKKNVKRGKVARELKNLRTSDREKRSADRRCCRCCRCCRCF